METFCLSFLNGGDLPVADETVHTHTADVREPRKRYRVVVAPDQECGRWIGEECVCVVQHLLLEGVLQQDDTPDAT